MQKWIIQPLAGVLISIFWAAGDKLFDWFVTVERADKWRAAALRSWTLKNQANDQRQPTTELGKTWKANRKNMLDAEGVYMGFVPYMTVAERAERFLAGGGVHQP
jgi:hypothetical protein